MMSALRKLLLRFQASKQAHLLEERSLWASKGRQQLQALTQETWPAKPGGAQAIGYVRARLQRREGTWAITTA